MLVRRLASSFDNSSDEVLYQLSSDIYDEDILKDKYSGFGAFITEAEAIALGKELQPAREVDDRIEGKIDFIFTLPNSKDIRLAKLKMTDKAVPRGLEDLVLALLSHNIIKEEDIPATLKAKIDDKTEKRGQL